MPDCFSLIYCHTGNVKLSFCPVSLFVLWLPVLFWKLTLLSFQVPCPSSCVTSLIVFPDSWLCPPVPHFPQFVPMVCVSLCPVPVCHVYRLAHKQLCHSQVFLVPRQSDLWLAFCLFEFHSSLAKLELFSEHPSFFEVLFVPRDFPVFVKNKVLSAYSCTPSPLHKFPAWHILFN